MSRILSFLIVIALWCSCDHINTPLAYKARESGNAAELATGFTLQAKGSSKVIAISNPWQHATHITYQYLLSDTLKASASIDDRTWQIRTPVNRVVCLSTTHIGFIEALGKAHTICGISGKDYVVNETIRQQVANGQVHDVGFDDNLNYELILELKPDVVFAYGVTTAITNVVKKLNELGLPVVLIGEYLEEDPLAKMEWIKVFAAFYGLDEMASQRFNAVVNSYGKLKEMAAAVENQPAVLLGIPWQGTWYVSGSKSYIARLVNDAGGKYLWDHLDFNESRPMGLEKIYERAMSADCWINPGEASSLHEIMTIDERFGQLPPFRSENVFNNNNRLSVSGGNDFYEQGVVEPDSILCDLICILHPDLLPMHNLKYYRKLH